MVSGLMPASVAPSNVISKPAEKSISNENGEKMNSASNPMYPCTAKPPAAAYTSTFAPNCSEFDVTAR